MADENRILEKTIREKVEVDTGLLENAYVKPSDFYAPYVELPYYHGLLRNVDVAELLARPGEFLLRFAMPTTPTGPMRPFLSVYPVGSKSKDEIVHIEITTAEGKYTVETGGTFDTVALLVTHYQTEKKSVHPTASALLNKPAKRHRWQLRNYLLKMERKLGEGTFAQVNRGILRVRAKEREVAIKICRENEKITKEQMLNEVMKEVHIMKPLRHRHVVRLYGVAMDYEPIMIVMELVRGGSLQRYLRKNPGKIPTLEKLERMILGAACGIQYIHEKTLIHRDIAARNCLYSKDICKISDFGLACVGESFKLKVVCKVPFKSMAPEVFCTFRYTPKSDVYAFGVMIWEIFMDGKEPYPDKRLPEVKAMVVSGARLTFPDTTPPEIKEMTNTCCWATNPDDRLTMAQIVRKLDEFIHKYVNELSRSKSDNIEEDVEPGEPPRNSAAHLANVLDRSRETADKTEDKTDHKDKTVDCEISTYSTMSVVGEPSQVGSLSSPAQLSKKGKPSSKRKKN
ncbi:unnamed protein product [Bursaphelenchus okinawaensis]|uniref:Tyrosine-protein kinase n=1 Tax=Bursaphelenchus okinawaensis TaxID=465554 RepID=A0A811KWW1_9BILA|nr:unnamed protein product [Bursaphelenchus okinawaensis]CAG9113158.1 unnamed protein product [Bursaphelenchus okinawaensis]